MVKRQPRCKLHKSTDRSTQRSPWILLHAEQETARRLVKEQERDVIKNPLFRKIRENGVNRLKFEPTRLNPLVFYLEKIDSLRLKISGNMQRVTS